MWAVARVELTQLFATPIAYAAIAVFWAASGYFFSFNVLFVSAPHMVTTFHNMSLLMLLLVPLFTMRSYAEENQRGTLEWLLSTPLRETEITLGKFLAAECLLLLLLAGTTTAVLPLALYGRPDFGPIGGGYAGLFLLGSAFVAIGLLISSLCRQQSVAAVVAWAVFLFLWFSDYPAGLRLGYAATRILHHLSLSNHSVDLIRGVITLEALVYLPSLATVALVATAQGLRLRRA